MVAFYFHNQYMDTTWILTAYAIVMIGNCTGGLCWHGYVDYNVTGLRNTRIITYTFDSSFTLCNTHIPLISIRFIFLEFTC